MLTLLAITGPVLLLNSCADQRDAILGPESTITRTVSDCDLVKDPECEDGLEPFTQEELDGLKDIARFNINAGLHTECAKLQDTMLQYILIYGDTEYFQKYKHSDGDFGDWHYSGHIHIHERSVYDMGWNLAHEARHQIQGPSFSGNREDDANYWRNFCWND